MSASNVAWGPGPWLVYGVVLGPAAAPPESIGPRLTPGSHVSDSSTSHNGSSLIRAVESSSVRQLLNQMSLDEKRALVEAMLGVSLDWLMEGRATAETASGPAPASMRPPTVTNAFPAGALSPREREVALLVARGLSNREIAESLVVSVRTVEAHVTHLLTKLRLRSRAQIAVWASQHVEQLAEPARPLRRFIHALAATPRG